MKARAVTVFLLNLFRIFLLLLRSSPAAIAQGQGVWIAERESVIDVYLENPKPVIVIDCDNTVVETTVVQVALFFFVGSLYTNVVSPFPDAVETIGELSATHNIIFLTARPHGATAGTTLRWLDHNGFATAPVFFGDGLLITHNQRVAYKSAVCSYLKNDLGLDLVYGIGDAPSDVVAYVQNNMTPFLILESYRDNDLGLTYSYLGVESLPEETPSLGKVLFDPRTAWASIYDAIQGNATSVEA